MVQAVSLAEILPSIAGHRAGVVQYSGTADAVDRRVSHPFERPPAKATTSRAENQPARPLSIELRPARVWLGSIGHRLCARRGD
jgi:hypothetical protein